jgi:thioredoxin 1
MNKALAALVAIIALGGVVFAIISFTSTFESPAVSPKSDSANNPNQQKTPTTGNTNQNIGKYFDYSKEAFEQAANNRRVLFFYANWCPTCRPIDAEFKTKSSEIPKDVAIIRVNYNDTETDQEEKDLARKYGITYQHTFVLIDLNAVELKKWNGGGIDKLKDNTI